MKEKQSVPKLQFSVRSEWSVTSLSKCCTFRENHFLWKCLKVLTNIHQQIPWVSLKVRQSVPTLQFTVWSEGELLHFLNAVVTEIIPFYWNCLKLLTSIHQQITCVSLKEKQSVPTLQFTVQSEWSVASLSKCCPFRENHFPLIVP